MKSKLKTVFLNFNENEEKDKLEYRIIYSKLMNDGIILNENELEKVKSSLLKKEYRNFFLTFLSNQRKNGKYTRKKEIIEILGIILNKILDITEQDIDYNSVKNTILLSQTFYYENENKEKIYIEESIKNHHYIKKIDFWKNLIEYMISEEINRQYEPKYNNFKEFPMNINSKNTFLNSFNFEINKHFNEKKEEEKQNIIAKICFTQLISYVNVMQQFGINKNQINELITLFSNKYSIVENDLEQIYAIMN